MPKHSAAIYLLSSRSKLLEACLINLYKNWNSTYDYEVYVHYFGDIYLEKYINYINKTISKKIYFIKIDYDVPRFIEEKDLFYNRKYLKYVRESFSKRRLGYLHMEHFVVNIFSFGCKGCLSKDLEKYEKLMRIDDDSYFKEKINFDLFDILEEFPFATGYAWSKLDYRVRDTRENLWTFYKNYLNKFSIKPKNEKLLIALKTDNEDLMHNLDWSAGNLNLYNMNHFVKNQNWLNFLNEVNCYGGTYKHRWGDVVILGLFAYTHFDKPLYNFDLKKKGMYDNKFPSILSGIAPSINSSFDVHNSIFVSLFSKIKSFIKNFT